MGVIRENHVEEYDVLSSISGCFFTSFQSLPLLIMHAFHERTYRSLFATIVKKYGMHHKMPGVGPIS